MHPKRIDISVSAARQICSTVSEELLFSPKIERVPQGARFANWATVVAQGPARQKSAAEPVRASAQRRSASGDAENQNIGFKIVHPT
jgi:hypothetical protein